MSIFRNLDANCPGCDTPVTFELVYSVAADRRPDLREAILDGSFQRKACPTCGTQFRAEPEFSYMDISLGLYIGVWPVSMRAKWREQAERTQKVFDDMLGPGASREAQEIGKRLQARAVFGWAALVEKILARQAGIDDRTLEIAKAMVMRNLDTMPVPGAQEFRLLRLEDEDPVFGWVRTSDGVASNAVRVPRKLIGEIEATPEKWEPLRERIGDGLVVDLQREMLAD
ncbi:MAG: CpXC domain-containing protein [Piscinibacter sp.]|nr:CpXC domain-containing protein [Piscinibacter sp.]